MDRWHSAEATNIIGGRDPRCVLGLSEDEHKNYGGNEIEDS